MKIVLNMMRRMTMLKKTKMMIVMNMRKIKTLVTTRVDLTLSGIETGISIRMMPTSMNTVRKMKEMMSVVRMRKMKRMTKGKGQH